MENLNEKTVLETIRDNYTDIFAAERKVADFILENPRRAVDANVSELAGLSGVSDATVVRLCKHIGYKGYYQMRICLSRDLGRSQLADDTPPDPTDVFGLFQSYASNMMSLVQNISQAELEACADLIGHSGYTHVMAVGNTSPVAQYLSFCLGQAGVKSTCHLIPEYALNNINLADHADVVVGISKSGSSKQVVHALELARARGLKTIAITGHRRSPLSQLADHLLLTGVEPTPFDTSRRRHSRLAETAVVDALVYFVGRAAPAEEPDTQDTEMMLSEYKF